MSIVRPAGVFAFEKYENAIATAAPIKVEDNLESAVLSLRPGPITISAVTGTFTDATSPRCNARATTEHKSTVIATEIRPRSNIVTQVSATPAPRAVPTI